MREVGEAISFWRKWSNRVVAPDVFFTKNHRFQEDVEAAQQMLLQIRGNRLELSGRSVRNTQPDGVCFIRAALQQCGARLSEHQLIFKGMRPYCFILDGLGLSERIPVLALAISL